MLRRATILAVLTLAVPVSGEVVRLRDGTTLTGTVHATGGGYSVTPVGGGIAHLVAAGDVRSFELTGTPTTRPATDGPAVDRSAAADRANELAAHGRQLLRRGDLVGAEATARAALDVDRHNATALYLRGVLAFDSGDTPAARQFFEAADRAVPNDGPTLNNLAVVLWRQNQPVAAMARYDSAMRASPGDRRVLDNVAAAVQALPVGAVRTPAVVRAVRRFQEQDAELAKRMAAAGQRRIDGAWASDEQVAELSDRQRQVVTALDQLAAGSAEDGRRLADLDGRLVALDRERAGVAAAGDGVPVAAPLPDRRRIGAAAAAADGLRADRAVIVARLNLAAAQAAQLRQRLPADVGRPRQRAIGVEGTPFIPARP